MKLKLKMTNRKAQQEIAGFVIIVVFVTIIGLVFLSFLVIKGEKSRETSLEVSSLLKTSMYYTSECATGFIPQYKDVSGLIKYCYNNERCLDQRESCEVLKLTFEKIIDESLDVNENSPNKAYKLNIYSRILNSTSPASEVLKFGKGNFGNCSSEIGAAHSIYINPYGREIINIELEVCKG